MPGLLLSIIGTVSTVLICLGIVIAVVCSLRNIKKNKGCSCGCNSCPYSENCREKKTDKDRH